MDRDVQPIVPWGLFLLRYHFFYRRNTYGKYYNSENTYFIVGCGTTGITKLEAASAKAPVDYVNPYMGNISHLLVPTYPIVHLPNSMLRVYPQRGDYTSDKIHGLPLIQISHRGSFAFNLSPFQGMHPIGPG